MERSGRIVGGTAVTCVALVACGGGERPRQAAPVAAQRSSDLSVVAVDGRIGAEESHGSGIVIDGNGGLVLTSAHTVWGARTLKLTTALGIVHGRIVARAPCDDLALVETYPRIPGLAALGVATGASPARGQLLRSLGRRRADPDSEGGGMASIPVRVRGGAPPSSPLPAPTGAVALDTPLVPEVSGGPVVDAAGRLVGMAHAVGRSAAVVPWAVIERRLGELRPGPRTVYVGWRDQYRCTGRQATFARAGHREFRPADARLDAPVRPTRVPGTEDMEGG